MLAGDNGLIKQAQNASDEWKIAHDLNDKDADIVDNGDGTYDVTTENGNTFEVAPVPDEENAEDIEIDYIGQGEIVGPRINKINITEKTKTSISIEVTTRNAEEG